MTNHLTPSEFVDLLEGQLAAVRVRHLDTCQVCRSQFDDLREAFRASSEVQLPEPSPLFWDHFSNRVREGIDAPRSVERSWPAWLRSKPGTALAGLAAFLILLAAGWRVLPRPQPSPVATSQTSTAAGAPSDVIPPGESGLTNDADWEPVRAAAENVRWDDAEAEGIGVRPGSIERAILELDDNEQRSLMSLLQEEIKRTGT